MARQPLLHDRLVCLAAPTQVWSGPDGQVRPGGIDGGYHADLRVLSEAVLEVDGAEPEAISSAPAGVGSVRVSALVRSLGDAGADPTVRVDRVRTATPGGLTETFEVSSAAAAPVRARLTVALAADLAPMDEVKADRVSRAAGPAERVGDALRWSDGDVEVVLTAAGATIDLGDPTRPVLTWDVDVVPEAATAVGYRVAAQDPGAVMTAARDVPWRSATVTGGDDRLAALLEQSLADLAGLTMATADAPEDTFLAAGAPWFFTLFGRDSLWAARMMLPLGTELAVGTLRTLAARQGERDDPETAEQPGKILHEVRRATMDAGGGALLPPIYYGTVDATPLWVCLLHDAWRWGMAPAEVEALLPHLERALEWMVTSGDADGDGFLEYVDDSGHGLANQGWKDSGDSIRWRDGTLAEPTIALCEVQGYAHEAAIGGAALLEAFGRPGAPRWREHAAQLRARFRERFWVSDVDGRYPAIALDGHKRPVDSLTSNIGHLLGTGILDAEEERLVADRLVGPALSSGFGVHTLAHGSGGFWPLRYHGGAVWPHDTAIAMTGMARAGLGEHARAVAEQLLRAAPSFDFRLPELFAGDRLEDVRAPAPYPAACRPQAWTAAAAVSLLALAAGVEPDVPNGVVHVRPTVPGPFAVRGLRIAGEELAITVGRDGATRAGTAAPVRLETVDPAH